MIFAEFLMLKMKDLMEKEVVTVAADQPVSEAVQAMVKNDIGSVVVLNEINKKVVGILTERDLMMRVMAKFLDPRATPVQGGSPLTIAANSWLSSGSIGLPSACRCRFTL